MKVVVLVLGFVLGAMAQMGEPDEGGPPKSLAELTQEIAELNALLMQAETAAAAYKVKGKNTIKLANAVMARVDDDKRRCLLLDSGLGPMPEPREPLEEVPLKELTEGEEKDLSQLTDEITSIASLTDGVAAAITKYVATGKSTIGIVARIAEAGRAHYCEDDFHIRCAMGFVHNAVTDACYREVVGRFKSFTEAQNACHNRGGHLPRPKSKEENDMLPTLLQMGLTTLSDSENLHALWLGIQRNAEGAWQFVHPSEDPEPINWTNFASEEEADDKTCTYLCIMSNNWIKRPCSDTVRVLCERNANPPPAVTDD